MYGEDVPLPPGRAGRAIAYALAATRLEETATRVSSSILANQAREFSSRLWTQAERELEMAFHERPHRGLSTSKLVKELAKDDATLRGVLEKDIMAELRHVLPNEIQRLREVGPELRELLEMHYRGEIALDEGVSEARLAEIHDVVYAVVELLRPDHSTLEPEEKT